MLVLPCQDDHAVEEDHEQIFSGEGETSICPSAESSRCSEGGLRPFQVDGHIVSVTLQTSDPPSNTTKCDSMFFLMFRLMKAHLGFSLQGLPSQASSKAR